jgi:tetratricopeptide (TPR) repeat protein
MTVRCPSCKILLAAFCLAAGLFHPSAATAQNPDEIKGAPAEPSDARETRHEIDTVRKLEPSLPDRGAALYFLAVAQQHLRNTLEALDLLKQCLALQEGFDPSGDPAFLEFKDSKEFTALIENVHRQFPSLAQARQAFRTTEKDLIPEGLAYDEQRNVFYMSSLHRRKIIRITQDAVASDFASPEQLSLLPVRAIHVNPDDGTIWADSFSDSGRAELLHFDGAGKLLGRFQPPAASKHGFNDFVIRKNGEVLTTDSLTNAVYRFNPFTHAFSPLSLHRPLFYPNGIALSADGRALYIADELGVITLDLSAGLSRDVDPGPHNTLAGIDGLYWHNGSLVAVQNGIGSPRIVAFRLSSDGLRVTRATVLENRTSFTVSPTTGAIHGSDFFFIANSQIDNLNGDEVMDVTRLEPVRVGVLRLPN